MKISVVIPTRNGGDYLRHCISSCLANEDPNLEVIVSDNNSTDNTRSVAESFAKDHRLSYYNTNQDVSMRKNYEFALSKVTGDYVIYIGDDDGLTKNGIKVLRQTILQHQPDVINWDLIYYRWPNTVPYQNNGIISYSAYNFFRPAVFKNAHQTLEKFCNAEIVKYKQGACLYHGCVKRDLLEHLKRDGVFFNAQNPDVYSSIALLSVAKKIISIGYPISIGGESNKSTGLAMLGNEDADKKNTPLANSFVQLANKDDIPTELNMNIKILSAIVYACLNRANSKIYNGKLHINHGRWRETVLKEIEEIPTGKCKTDLNLLAMFFKDMDPTFLDSISLQSTRVNAPPQESRPNIITLIKHALFRQYPAYDFKTISSVTDWLQRIEKGLPPEMETSVSNTLPNKIKSMILLVRSKYIRNSA